MKKVSMKEPKKQEIKNKSEKISMKKLEKKNKSEKISMKKLERKNKSEKISMKKLEKKNKSRKTSMKKLQVCEENQGNETKDKKPKACGAGGISIWYNGDPTRCLPHHMETMKKYAELVIDVFNKTHLNKYSFVDMVHTTSVNFGLWTLHMVFTVKPEPEEDGVDKYPIIVRARVSISNDYVDYFEFPEDEEDSETPIFPIGSVFYDGNPTSCDDETMKTVQRCADLVMEVYNKTHLIEYSLVELVRATRHLSPGFMIDLVFIAKSKYDYGGGHEEYPKEFRARVSVTHNYVEFVEIVDRPCLL
ncbi:hypothetical protein MIMGU_mgv1a010748mg [Erythranthe guttata]|uniref:Cystatin domain-containing protein n=1 Tax=Erythranthe guttata TaxID=4155 RepID=A0A022PVU3_ERYGU|nr:PREDICTED: uncharacterized protein LOC105977544 [Erythranthe guttata]XP_012858314.1 PREDICTED: uncharacterized protein LOC105977544 [Erythranthe guttata]EYU19916.1 hypothetical protein MIMGU_mgv1a010748mg [Erythranthe guttata]|eukprot:XP_012858313.1 PREDICTED: uncharacterized protein LOC105977544 [Erythranthe guttata]